MLGPWNYCKLYSCNISDILLYLIICMLLLSSGKCHSEQRRYVLITFTHIHTWKLANATLDDSTEVGGVKGTVHPKLKMTYIKIYIFLPIKNVSQQSLWIILSNVVLGKRSILF